ncbi:glycerate kinase [uncultured Anaerococcus sp.]|uniref:glycerate kinase n=1 Tax=uncultured Anaerococcus sp. TaxID=293428 RepID=UPI00260B7A1D|nr:glycerate kinase [uncultured Anaerococcus sp.]
MKVLVMLDSFKGSLSSIESGMIVKNVLEKRKTNYEVEVLPIADGGEGTVESFVGLSDIEEVKVKVNNPLFESHIARYAYSKKDNLAIMEMSEASGLTLIKDRLSPMNASTYGVGEMILDALDKGASNFIIGIGGSATNDGGIGMLSALGYQFLDKDDKEINPGIGGVYDLIRIDDSNIDPRLKDAKFNIACDVDNPLNGTNGSAHVYGPQKGATPEQVEIIDELLLKYHNISKQYIESADNTIKGVGAAGGLGYGFKTYLDANLTPGIDLILDFINAEEHIKDADLVITGEGKIDFQTSMGKAPVGVARLAKKYDKPVVAFAGIVDNDAIAVNDEGIDAFFPIIDKLTSVDEAMSIEKSKENLERSVSQVFNLIEMWRK